MIRRIFLYIITLITLAGCSDDFSSPFRGGVDSDGNLNFSFSITPVQKIGTRADEGFTSVRMYAFKADKTLLQCEDIAVTALQANVRYSGRLTPNKNLSQNLESAKFYFVANIPGDVHGDATVEDINVSEDDLKGTYTENLLSNDCYTLSSGVISHADIQAGSVMLVHNAVQVSVNYAKKENGAFVFDENDKDLYVLGEAVGFDVIGSATSSPILAGGLNAEGVPTAADFSKFNETTLVKLIHPTDNDEGNANKTYVIIKASYENHDYYYRLDFQKGEKLSSGLVTSKPFDVEANHWYQFIIKDVLGAGYSTVEEAAKNPTPMVDYQIHDHAPVIYNMISDGSRELGVGKEVVNRSSAVGSTANLNIKFFSPIDGEDSELTIDNWEKYITIDAEWLTVTGISKLEDAADVGDEGTAADPNHKGTVYAVQLQFNATKEPGTITTDLSVTWHGLTRYVPVKWIRDFDSKDLLKEVKIRAFEGVSASWDNSGSQKWDKNTYDYFTDFIPNKSVGTSEDANNGESRADGLHFPVSYGDNNKWTYIYRVVLNSELVSNGETCTVASKNISSVEFSTSGNGSWSDKVVLDSSSLVFYVRCTNTGYEYQKGNLVLTINSGAGKPVDYDNIKLYHTGFFHKDKTSWVKDKINSGYNDKFTYYEVVTCGDDHWLDRNIGSESAAPYIMNAMGDKNASGYYIIAGEYNKYNSPKIYSDDNQDLLPPGYDVPTQVQWDNLRNSGGFSISLYGGAYYNVSFNANEKVIYFPKAQFYEGSSNLQGEARAGYYWTRTASTGTEKDEVGNWLKCLSMAGTATSYVNGKVKGKDSNQEYYMSLRAVSEASAATVNRLSFMVKGATHVYLYTQSADGKTRYPVTTWPGQAIGNYSTVSTPFNFSYETSVNSVNDFYVIFNYVGSNGQIYTMSNNAFTGSVTHTNISPQEAKGWEAYGASKNSDFNLADCGVSINDNTSGKGTTWTCASPIPITRKYRIYWQRKNGNNNDPANYWKIIIYKPGTNTIISQATDKAEWDNASSYYYHEFSLTGTKEELDKYEIYPVFIAADGNNTRWRKSSDNGIIKLSYFSLDGSTYSYGKASGQLSQNDITQE